jgi:hypothetical protein
MYCHYVGMSEGSSNHYLATINHYSLSIMTIINHD